VENALITFQKGYNCAQSVLSSFEKETHLSRANSLLIASPFGGGIARLGKTCGAVTGALMVIGLIYGDAELRDNESKTRTYNIANEFIKKFEAINKTVECKELINCDLTDPEARKKASEYGIFEKVCNKLIKDAVEILEELFINDKNVKQ